MKQIVDRIRRIWRSLTGGGVATYDDPPRPGAHDGDNLGAQASAEGQVRNRLRGSQTP